MQIVARMLFIVLVMAMLYLALTPGPLGSIIADGEQRHVLAFTMLPLIGSVGWPGLSLRLQFVLYAMLGGTIEIAQEWMGLGRAGEWADWSVDCLATAAALLVVGIIRGKVFPRPPASVPATK
ncbi:hypothetical protein [Sphingomonas sp. 37zxx]|uniref:hypothetical protein n=1 Tax=Sphingomonas sp. 37zxx TaxID=1550073 RepID=UPI00103D6B9B|nr:hypothetical protein [Sphingomonas sp. 37zxx]